MKTIPEEIKRLVGSKFFHNFEIHIGRVSNVSFEGFVEEASVNKKDAVWFRNIKKSINIVIMIDDIEMVQESGNNLIICCTEVK